MIQYITNTKVQFMHPSSQAHGLRRRSIKTKQTIPRSYVIAIANSINALNKSNPQSTYKCPKSRSTYIPRTQPSKSIRTLPPTHAHTHKIRALTTHMPHALRALRCGRSRHERIRTLL